jgi:hypothetical protein
MDGMVNGEGVTPLGDTGLSRRRRRRMEIERA